MINIQTFVLAFSTIISWEADYLLLASGKQRQIAGKSNLDSRIHSASVTRLTSINVPLTDIRNDEILFDPQRVEMKTAEIINFKFKNDNLLLKFELDTFSSPSDL